MHRRAAAAITPSGAPPVPRRMSIPRSGSQQAMAAAMSPSPMRRILAPADRISPIRPLCRGRSRTMAVSFSTGRPFASASRPRFSRTGLRMSTVPSGTPGPTAIFSM